MKSPFTIIPLLAPVIMLSLASCATTLSNRSKTLSLMTVAAAGGGGLGAGFAPVNENQSAHAVMWAGVSAAVASAVGLFVFDEQAKTKAVEARAEKLERELIIYREESEPKLIANNGVGLQKALPEKFKHLVIPGQWSLYKVDRWVSTSDNELVHQDHLFRFSQAQLNPAGRARGEEQSQGGKNHEE